MAAFAANSVLCRLALGTTGTDPATFTAVRLLSGSLALWGITRVRGGPGVRPGGDWRSAVALFVYAAAFSFAYLWLTTGTGALILFGSVQLTMIGWGAARGERMRPMGLVGTAVAVTGLVALLAPGLDAPAPAGAALMAVAGIAWGVYSLRGRASRDPMPDTAGNFLRAALLGVGLTVAFAPALSADVPGVVLAVLSGAVASGLGYAVWYTVLPHMPAMSAALVQLSVPVLAAIAGVILVDEDVTIRLAVATIATLGGIWLALRVGPATSTAR